MLWGVLYITEGLVVMLIYVSRDLSCIYIKALNVTQLLLQHHPQAMSVTKKLKYFKFKFTIYLITYIQFHSATKAATFKKNIM